MPVITPPARLTQVVLVVALLLTIYLATTPLEYPVISDINDKLQHIFAFFTLAFLADHAFPKHIWNWRKFIPLLGYGLILEIIQYTIPGRFFSLLDLGADALGLLVYTIFLSLLRNSHLQQDSRN
ncbi:MAG: VanZ family protein [Pseudomonadota bacterium]